MKENGFLKFVSVATYTLVIVGAINWGLVGIFDFDLVAYLFGQYTTLSRTVYALVGISAIISVICASICLNKTDKDW